MVGIIQRESDHLSYSAQQRFNEKAAGIRKKRINRVAIGTKKRLEKMHARDIQTGRASAKIIEVGGWACLRESCINRMLHPVKLGDSCMNDDCYHFSKYKERRPKGTK